ncbi:hypothetical protein OEZ86_007000 [Tetradesmus obliquus]|nr:hypothetical protein OEZ86_007000 [Tetradesmus obliquus]
MIPSKLLLAACLLAVLSLAAANDIPVKFCAKDCKGAGLRGLTVRLSGCTDRTLSCRTGHDGCCSISRAPNTIQYCSGSANNLCKWSISSSNQHLVANVKTLTRNGKPVTANQYSCCKCNGKDHCPKVIYGDAAHKSCPSGNGGIRISLRPLHCEL